MSALHDLNRDLGRALGLPPRTTRAVLTLEVGKVPLLEVECYVTDNAGHPIVEGEGLVRRLARVQFMLRLEPFEEPRRADQG